MSGDDCPQKINFSSSEDEYLFNSDTGDIEHVNLDKRRSKMGRTKAESASKRSKKNNSANEKEKSKEKENSKKHLPSVRSDRKGRSKADVLSESKKAMTNISSGFITTRRLTTGVTGIFGNSRTSNIVKRRGKRMSIDLVNRKTSVAVKEQVSRNLDRIINPSYEQKSNQLNNTSFDEPSVDEQLSKPAFGSTIASDYHQTKVRSHSRNIRPPSSSSSSGGRSGQFITPVTRLLSETPLVEISKNLKDSFAIVRLFPGRRFVEEIKSDLRKIHRQECSLLDDSVDQSTLQAQESRIAPITVLNSKYPKSFERISREEAAPVSESTVPPEERMDMQIVECKNMMKSNKQYGEAKTLSSHPTAVINTLSISAFQETDNKSTKNTNIGSECPPPFQIISRVIEPIGYEARKTEPVTISDGFVQPCELIQQFPSHETSNAQWRDCAVAVHRLPYSTSQFQQDSGTYSEESSAREKAATDRILTADTYKADDIRPGGMFQPRRQGNKDNLLRNNLYCHEMLSTEQHDDDYHLSTNNFDILHYAETMDYKEEGRDITKDKDIANPLNAFSYLPVPKKPCLETPTPPLQLFRLKMF